MSKVWTAVAVGLLTGCGAGGDDGKAFPGAQGSRDDFHGIAIADLDGDGLSDLVAAHERIDPAGPDFGSVAVFLRDRDDPARFLPPVDYPLDAVPYDVSIADLDADARPDAVASCTFAESGVRVLLQTEAGALGPPEFLAAPASVYETATADFDGDGLADIVAAIDNALVIFAQHTDDPGTFAPAARVGAGSQRLEIGDLDRDDLVDLVSPRDVEGASAETVVHLQDPGMPGAFLPPALLVARHPVGDVASADLDGDGVPDLAVAGVSGAIGSFRGAWTVFVQDPMQPGQFQLAEGWQLRDSIDTRVALSDLEGDGDVDAVLGRRTSADDANAFDVFRHDGDGFVLDARYSMPDDRAVTVPELYDVVLADVDGDALVDVVVSTNEIFYFPQRADAPGTFGPAVRIAGQR